MTKKILITGSSGFIGSHLTELLVEDGYEVKAFDRYNSNNDYGWLNKSKYKKDIEFILGDIRDYDSVFNSLKGCNYCAHLAALIGIPYSYLSPLAYIRTNIEGTYNVLEASKNLDIEQIITTSTSETYGSAQYEPIDENHPTVGQSPYSASKIAADQLATSYYLSFNTPVKIIRPFNTFGPRQSTRAIIPTIITQLLDNKKNIYLGNINTKRDFTYVDDTCLAYLKILNSDNIFGKTINVGMNKSISIKELFNFISEKLNIESKIILDDLRVRNIKSEVSNLICDNKKLVELTDWKANFDLSTGIDNTINWIKENKKYFNSDIYHV